MEDRDQHQAQDAPRQKRFKVGRACHTCRVKKIKCDGLNPCMQCKARRRPCSFSQDQDGAVPAAKLDDEPSLESSSPPTINQDGEEEKAKASLKRASEILERLVVSLPGKGREGKWAINEEIVDRDPLHSTTALLPPPPPACPDMPSQSLQQRLVSLYFEQSRELFPIISKRIFYKHFEHSNTLITPLMLLSIFAHAAQCDTSLEIKADGYFRQAQDMLDDYLDIPRMSTVIALCLLSIYEPKRSLRSRSSIYRTMALNMCAGLGLLKRNGYRSKIHTTLEDMELRKSVSWGCYYIDMIQSISTGRPRTLRSNDIEPEVPILATDNVFDEALVAFRECIHLLKIYERAADTYREAEADILFDYTDVATQFTNELTQWYITEQAGTISFFQSHLLHPRIISLPQPPPVVQLLTIFNMVHLFVVRPAASSPGAPLAGRGIGIATELTHTTKLLIGQPNKMFSATFTAYAAIAAVRYHTLFCGSNDAIIADHARSMFQESLSVIQQLLRHRWINGVDRFIVNLEESLSVANGSTFLMSHDGEKADSWTKSDLEDKSKQDDVTSDESASIPSSYLRALNDGSSGQPALHDEFLWSSPNQHMVPSSMNSLLHRVKNMPETQRSTAAAAATWRYQKRHQDFSVAPKSPPLMPSPLASDFSWHMSKPGSTRPDRNSNYDHHNVASAGSDDDLSLMSLGGWGRSPNHALPQPTSHNSSSFQYQPMSYMSIGLGVYASAHQHHNDVIRHHFASSEGDPHLAPRPVVVTDQGQVMVSQDTQDNVTIQDDS